MENLKSTYIYYQIYVFMFFMASLVAYMLLTDLYVYISSFSSLAQKSVLVKTGLYH